MPDPRDFLPLLPWEGPPIPRGLVHRAAPKTLRPYKIGDRLKSSVWTDVHGRHPWLTVKGINIVEWVGEPMIELEVTDGIQTYRVFEDTIIAYEYP